MKPPSKSQYGKVKATKVSAMKSQSFFKKGNSIKPVKATRDTFKPASLPKVRAFNLTGKIKKF